MVIYLQLREGQVCEFNASINGSDGKSDCTVDVENNLKFMTISIKSESSL